MRIPVRWKLILSIGLPLLAVYFAVLFIAYDALKSATFRGLENQMRLLALHQAARFDGELHSAAQVARSTAEFLNTQGDLSEDELTEVLTGNINQSPLIYGAAVAFEPGGSSGGQKFYAPYMHRTPAGEGVLAFGDLSRTYSTPYSQWEWYDAPKKKRAAHWSEPYFDEGGGNVVMCTHSVPFFYRDGRLRGIATIDVRLADLQNSVGTAELGELGEVNFVIISRAGTFISHPQPELIMRETTASLAKRLNLPDPDDLRRRLSGDAERGVVRVPAFPDEPHYLFYAPIPSTGWSFIAAVPEESVMAPVWRRLRWFIAAMLLGLAMILGVVMAAAVRISRPMERLAAATRELARGNLDAHVAGVESADEIGDLGAAFNRMVADLKAHVEALTREVANRQSVESELRLAREIQTSLLPRTFPPFPERDEFDLHACNLSAKVVAGDFYDFFFVSDDVLAVVMADVSGKGVPAALFMAVARTVLRDLAMAGLSAAKVLDDANEVLTRDNDQFMFVTIFLGFYDTRSGRLRYANAGHPAPYRMVCGDAGSVRREGSATGTLLGVLADERYTEGEMTLAVGERLLLYTDGIPEAMDADRTFYGDRRFEEFILRHVGEPVERFCKLLTDDVCAYQGGELQDDVTVLVFRRNR